MISRCRDSLPWTPTLFHFTLQEPVWNSGDGPVLVRVGLPRGHPAVTDNEGSACIQDPGNHQLHSVWLLVGESLLYEVSCPTNCICSVTEPSPRSKLCYERTLSNVKVCQRSARLKLNNLGFRTKVRDDFAWVPPEDTQRGQKHRGCGLLPKEYCNGTCSGQVVFALAHSKFYPLTV